MGNGDTGLVIGIDLGTTNSVVAVAEGRRVQVLLGEDGQPLIPSVVSFPPEGPPLVGHAARARRLHDARNTVYSVKRLIGRPFQSPEVERARRRFAFDLVERQGGGVGVRVRDGEVFTLTEISAMVLRELRRIAEGALARPIDRAVITVPANFNELQRSATRAAGRVVGLRIARILNEPTAAALAYGQDGPMRRVAVYDLGGGTFDVTFLEMEDDVYEVLTTAGDTFLGGDDIDLAVADVMADRLAERTGRDPRTHPQTFERLRAAAEWIKCALSDQLHAEIRLEAPFGRAEHTFRFEMSREQLEQLAAPLVERSLNVCEEAMREAGLRRERLDAVVLVGGSTRMPLVRREVARFFGRPPACRIDPDLVVGQGAAVHAAALGRHEHVFVHVAAAEQSAPPSTELPSPFREPENPEPASSETPSIPSPSWEPAETVMLDPNYARDVERIAPGALRRYVDLGDGLVEVEVALPEETGKEIGSEEEPSGVIPPPDALAPPVLFGLPPSEVPREAIPELPGAWLHTEPPSAPPPSVPLPRAAPGLTVSDRPPPLLMDVTPLALAVETAGGYCQRIIERGTPVPTEQRRLFTTARDGQRTVRARICQGPHPRFEENQALGTLELEGLREAPRGTVRIEVTFSLDADGTLHISARDVETGRSQSTRIVLLGAEDEQELQALQERQRTLFGETPEAP